MKITLPVIGVVICALVGCGSSSDLKEVTGTVQLKKKALDFGEIQFHPEDANAGNQARAEIENGAFKVPAAKGLKPGKYRVIISAPDRKVTAGADEAPGGAPPPPKERIPARFNSASKEIVEVTTSGPNKFDFDIP